MHPLFALLVLLNGVPTAPSVKYPTLAACQAAGATAQAAVQAAAQTANPAATVTVTYSCGSVRNPAEWMQPAPPSN